MACYVDTSVWVALLSQEARGPAVARWLQGDVPLVTSRWTAVEIASALSIKARRGELSQTQVSQACQAFRDVLDGAGVAAVDCVGTDFQEAALLCEHVASGLRSGGALHLAVAQRTGSSLFLSFDRTLNQQAERLGLQLIEIE